MSDMSERMADDAIGVLLRFDGEGTDRAAGRRRVVAAARRPAACRVADSKDAPNPRIIRGATRPGSSGDRATAS